MDADGRGLDAIDGEAELAELGIGAERIAERNDVLAGRGGDSGRADGKRERAGAGEFLGGNEGAGMPEKPTVMLPRKESSTWMARSAGTSEANWRVKRTSRRWRLSASAKTQTSRVMMETREMVLMRSIMGQAAPLP